MMKQETTDSLEFKAPDPATVKALKLIDSLAKGRTLEEIQALATDGKLEDLFPELFVDEPTPDLPKFDDLVEASSEKLTDRQFEEILRRS